MTYDLFHQPGTLVNYTEDQLATYTKRNKTQNKRVLNIFETGRKMGPSQVHEYYCKVYGEVPLTSIRRAITTLEKQGKLVKLAETVNGSFGRPEHVWRVA